MDQPSTSFRRRLLTYVRTAVIVVSVVALGLGMFAISRGEEVQWRYVVIIALAMVGSAIINALFDWIRNRRRGTP